MIYNTRDFNIDSTGKINVTKQLQDLINKLEDNDTLVINKGIYLLSPIYLKSNMTLMFESNATFSASLDESLIKDILTRVAGIDIPWYPAILNIIDSKNVTILGDGIINGNGHYYWNKYWGVDTHGGMRKEYDENNLRFLCDYDCKRCRNILVQNSSNIVIKDITSFESGFWNLHVLYSHDIRIDNVKIKSDFSNSPSTDGIDIDSSYNVIVENVVTECNDDSICVKSGRDMDGIRKNIPSHDITIRNCKILKGFGITIGSEVSGGVYNVDIENISYKNTDCGFRIKSSQVRKGYIKDIKINNLEMENVKYAFHLFLNWNPNYSICKLPSNYSGEITKALEKLIEEVPNSIENTKVSNITISNVKSKFDDTYTGISRAFNIEGFKEVPIESIKLSNIDITCKEFGVINYAKDIHYDNFNITVVDEENIENNQYDNR